MAGARTEAKRFFLSGAVGQKKKTASALSKSSVFRTARAALFSTRTHTCQSPHGTPGTRRVPRVGLCGTPAGASGRRGRLRAAGPVCVPRKRCGGWDPGARGVQAKGCRMRPAGGVGMGAEAAVEGRSFFFFGTLENDGPSFVLRLNAPRAHTLSRTLSLLFHTHSNTVSKHRTLQPYGGAAPSLGAGAFVAPGASVVGDVTIGDRASVWYNAVVRGTN